MSDSADRTPQPPIPRGIEVLVKKAAVDAEFRRLLLSDRAEAAALIELELDASERMMLSAVPEAQLEAIIERTTVPVEQRRVFLGKVAAAMLTALTAGGSVAAAGGFAGGVGGSGGIMPDRPMPAPTGVRPDLPEPVDPSPDPRPAMVARLAAVLGRHTAMPETEITAEKLLVTQLGIDAANAEKVCDALESEFKIMLSRRAFGQLRRVGDLARRIEAVAAVQTQAVDLTAKQLEVDAGGLTASTTLEKDLGVSRLQLAQLRHRLASHFRVYLDWDEFKKVETVGDVIDLVAQAVAKRADAAGESPPSPPVSRGIRPDRPMTFGI